MSCGRDNIRVWRVRHGALRSSAVNLAHHHNNHVVFTDIAFGRPLPDVTRVYVTSSVGSVVEFDATTLRVHAVHEITHVGLLCVSVCGAFVVTGDSSGKMRLWPLTFTESFMTAEHDSALTSVCLCEDSTHIAAATIGGNLGVLNVCEKSYKTLMRSHTDDVLCVVMHPLLPQFVSLSCDETMRVWCLETHTQLFEFKAPGDTPVCGTYTPSGDVVVCGFVSGFLRVFDVTSATLVCEHHTHTSPVTSVITTHDGTRLFSAGSDGLLVAYDTHQVCVCIQTLVCRAL